MVLLEPIALYFAAVTVVAESNGQGQLIDHILIRLFAVQADNGIDDLSVTENQDRWDRSDAVITGNFGTLVYI